MQSFLFAVAVLSLEVVASVQAKCEKGCAVPVAHYEETGCEPVFVQSGDCCPSHYTCAKFEARDANKCYVKDQVYEKGDHIDNTISQSNCLAPCFCSKSEQEDITCERSKCPEFLGVEPMGPGCYRSYDLDSCCSEKTVCPPFDNVTNCEVEGKTYNEGQKWNPVENTKLTCVCKPEFKGKLEAPFCVEPSCGIEFTNTRDIMNKCAPVFQGSESCPIQWHCLKEGDVVVSNQNGTTSEQKCRYGDKTLNVGDTLLLNQSFSSPKIDCECIIPPLITCIKKQDTF